MEPGSRPTTEQRLVYEEAYKKAMARKNPTAATAAALLAADKDERIAKLLHDQFIVACYLEDCLSILGAPEHYRKDVLFKFGRFCFGREPWDVFDKLIPSLVEEVRRVTERAEWADVPVPQEVPEPTNLLSSFLSDAQESVGEQGIFPMPGVIRCTDDSYIVMALALGGNDVFPAIIDVFRRADIEIAEAAFGIDMSSVPGQNLMYDDFLAVIWWVNGDFYTGVVNYQKVGDAEEPAWEPVDWANNYWNHSLRDHPLPKLLDAMEARADDIKQAEKVGVPALDDLPFNPLTVGQVAHMMRMMPPPLRGLVLEWGWEDTGVRESLFVWLLQCIWGIDTDTYFAKDKEGRYNHPPYRHLVEDGKRVDLPMDALKPHHNPWYSDAEA